MAFSKLNSFYLFSLVKENTKSLQAINKELLLLRYHIPFNWPCKYIFDKIFET